MKNILQPSQNYSKYGQDPDITKYIKKPVIMNKIQKTKLKIYHNKMNNHAEVECDTDDQQRCQLNLNNKF